MDLKKTVVRSFALAIMGFAITGAASGQTGGQTAEQTSDESSDQTSGQTAGQPSRQAPGQAPGPDLTDGTIIRDGQITTDTVTGAPRPGADAAGAADADAQRSAGNSNLGGQQNRGQAGNNVSAGTTGQNVDSRANSNFNTGENSTGTSKLNSFGAGFDSNATDRLIIQDVQPNSVASRLGLQPGDRIIELNGQACTDGSQFDRELAQFNTGNEMPIIYERNGTRYTRSFRMPSQNSQQTYDGSAGGNQNWNNQYNTGDGQHSAGRPIYGMSETQQGNMGGIAPHGNNSYQGQACCCGPVYVQKCAGGYRQNTGRRNRRCCR